jgi:putative ABC transport system ATP-binding protein
MFLFIGGFAMIRGENLVRRFRSGKEVVEVLKGINLTIAPQSLTILKGRSGSGKTTLMNLLAGLDQPTAGRIYFDNRELTAMTEPDRDNFRRLNIGFVFQSIALITMMSAYENVEFGLRVAGYEREKRKRRAEECLHLVGLGKRMRHRPQELSGGEQQRVAIARAIAHQPKVVFADEPTAELDTHMGLQIVKLFKELVEREGITILMATHDPGMMEIADQVFIMEDGEIVHEP